MSISTPVTHRDHTAIPTMRAATTTPTVLWNDSADLAELRESITFGAVGATCNPVIALTSVRTHLEKWAPRIRSFAEHNPNATEADLGWRVIETMSQEAAALLEPAFRDHHGRNGRLSIQTDPRLYRNAAALVDQAVYFSTLAPNMIVKIPATHTGIEAIEEATARGVVVNATVSFTVAQAIAVAEAIERGLSRRTAAGYDISPMWPVCTIMGGRLDDWLKAQATDHNILIDPGYFEWAGVAAMKRAYQIYQERGYRTRILSAAFRNHMHWSELVGGDVVISPPFAWQVAINANPLAADPRMDEPVRPEIIATLEDRIPDFQRAYDPHGMTREEFITFGATQRTLRQFLGAQSELDAVIRGVLLPDPLS